MVEVPVIAAFTHEGRALSPGDTVRVAPVVALALSRRGVVSLTKGYRTATVAPEPAAEPAAEPAPRRRRRYRRKDMVADE